MRPDRAWVRLQSGKRLNLLDPAPDSWTDADLAIGLARTYRWGGHSRWELPLSVAQHSLLVLVLRQQMQPHQPLTRGEALRELLHDGHEGFLSFAPISPVKPHLGQDFEDVAGRLQMALEQRYHLPAWSGDERVLHKRADRLAAASEAVHVAGWSPADLLDKLNIPLAPGMTDPLPAPDGFRPWEPWPAKRAASLFLYKLRELTSTEWTPEQPAGLDTAIERERELRDMAAAFSDCQRASGEDADYQRAAFSLTPGCQPRPITGWRTPTASSLPASSTRTASGCSTRLSPSSPRTRS